MSSHLRSLPSALVVGLGFVARKSLDILRKEAVRDVVAFAAVVIFILFFLLWSAYAADQVTYGRIQ